MHGPAVEALAARGLVGGHPDGTYRPDVALTRAQAATVLSRALGLSGGAPGRFADVPAGSTHADGVGALAAAGLTTGCTPTDFCPAGGLTRGQTASLLVRGGLAG